MNHAHPSRRPQVSVIVPTYNRPDRLRRALGSLALQEDVDVEAIVVNDAGCDVTAVLREQREDLHVELIDQPENAGLSAARNRGLARAQGDFVAFLDDDDLFLPHHLKTLAGALETTGADLAYGDCPVSPRHIDAATVTSEEVEGIEYCFDYPFSDDALLISNIIPVIAPLMRNIRGAEFDRSLPVQEDWDFFLQLRLRLGMRFHHVARRTTIYHRIPDIASMTTDPEGARGQNAVFRDTHRLLMERWPVPPGSVAAEYRDHMMVAYDLADQRREAGQPISHYFYERVLRVVHDALTGTGDPARLEADLSLAVADEPSTID